MGGRASYGSQEGNTLARGGSLDFCLICSPAPCECNAKPKKAVAKKQAKKPDPAEPASQPERQQQAISPARPRKRPGLSSVRGVTKTQEQVDEEAEMRRAVTVLIKSGIVAAESIREHRDLVDLTDIEIKAILWRQSLVRNKQHLEG